MGMGDRVWQRGSEVKVKQVKLPSWVGALWVQYMHSLSYISVINFGMLSVTLWGIAGVSIKGVVPWASYWLFLGFVICIIMMAMFLDYTLMYKTRQEYLNRQAVKHTNPAYLEIMEQSKRLKRIEKKLGIEEELDD